MCGVGLIISGFREPGRRGGGGGGETKGFRRSRRKGVSSHQED